jgi:hypothetical protein
MKWILGYFIFACLFNWKTYQLISDDTPDGKYRWVQIFTVALVCNTFAWLAIPIFMFVGYIGESINDRRVKVYDDYNYDDDDYDIESVKKDAVKYLEETRK